jgi:hypothetical protein
MSDARRALADAARGPEYRPPQRIDDDFALAVARRLDARGIVTVEGAEDGRAHMRRVLEYLEKSKELEKLDAERQAAAAPPPPLPPSTADVLRRVMAEQSAAAADVDSQPAVPPLNGERLLRKVLGSNGNAGTINGGQP